jgi:transcriptional regulator with XRE-family HTH domain|nr:MAG TPA: Repressor protein CI [Siphoviridae sp. ctMq01]
MQFDVQSVIRRIEIRLAEIGMTKQEFYEKSGISSGSFSQWNTGKHAPSIKKVQRAASVIGVTTEYLLYGVDPMPDFAVKSPIVARINALLAAKGIPKQQFYKDCGITSASYSLWNTGKTNPSMKNLKIIAEYLGVSVADLLPDDDPSAGIKKDPIPKDEAEDSETAELRDIWSSADENERRDLLKMARMLKSRRKQNG